MIGQLEPASDPYMLEMLGIYKRYGAVHANRDIVLRVKRGEILGLLGENGSGKSTLMKVLFGMVRPDAGQIRVNGSPLEGHDPAKAIEAGIGMIHQHFMLVNAMTVMENVMLGRRGWGFDRKVAARLVREASNRYGLEMDPEAIVADLSFGQRQRVEIIKAVLRGAQLLILDEPTSNLSAPEVGKLLSIMRQLAGEGRSIIFISHKMGEVLDCCDEIVVLRHGRVTGSRKAAGASRNDLARLMVGHDLGPPLPRAEPVLGKELLNVKNVGWQDAGGIKRLTGITFSVQAGEILAIAGVDGNGQTELVDLLAGLTHPSEGQIVLGERDVTHASVNSRLKAGLAYIPVDRASTSLVAGMSIENNLALRDFDRSPFCFGPWLNRAVFRKHAERCIDQYQIRCGGPLVPAQTLSGGNQQKVVVAREMGRHPQLLIAYQPTWGLDPGAARFVIDRLLELRGRGASVLFVSSELEEVLTIGDRIGVMSGGRLIEIVSREKADLTRIGLLMAGTVNEEA